MEKTHADWSFTMDANQPRTFCPGFTIADVEEKMRSESCGEGSIRRRASDSVTWRRLERMGQGVSYVKTSTESQGKRKKTNNKNEENERGKRGRTKSGGVASHAKELGLGLAEAGAQPRRPQ